MPLYEYKCSACGRIFEVIQKFSDPPLTIHPECGGEVVRLLSAPAFHLKGTGWYATDYGKKSGGSEPKSDSRTDAKPAPAESKTDVKPAVAAETKPSTTP